MGITLDSIKSKLLNRKFGKLTVLDYSGRSDYGDNLWDCLCDCGTRIVYRTASITVGDRAACTKCKISTGPSSQSAKVRLLGKIFSRLTVVRYSGLNNHRQYMWECLCCCGNKTTARGSDLTSGVTRSCGCFSKDRMSEVHTTHGLSKHPLYAIWWAMKERCYKPNHPSYNDWGGRGIKICEEWLKDFKTFYDWAISNGYQQGLSIDRFPNNDGNYEPDNVRWATRDEQSQNMRSTKLSPREVSLIRCDARTHFVIAKEYGVDASTVSRIKGRKTWSNITVS